MQLIKVLWIQGVQGSIIARTNFAAIFVVSCRWRRVLHRIPYNYLYPTSRPSQDDAFWETLDWQSTHVASEGVQEGAHLTPIIHGASYHSGLCEYIFCIYFFPVAWLRDADIINKHRCMLSFSVCILRIPAFTGSPHKSYRQLSSHDLGPDYTTDAPRSSLAHMRSLLAVINNNFHAHMGEVQTRKYL